MFSVPSAENAESSSNPNEPRSVSVPPDASVSDAASELRVMISAASCSTVSAPPASTAHALSSTLIVKLPSRISEPPFFTVTPFRHAISLPLPRSVSSRSIEIGSLIHKSVSIWITDTLSSAIAASSASDELTCRSFSPLASAAAGKRHSVIVKMSKSPSQRFFMFCPLRHKFCFSRIICGLYTILTL